MSKCDRHYFFPRIIKEKTTQNSIIFTLYNLLTLKARRYGCFSGILYYALEIYNYELFQKPLSLLLIITHTTVPFSLKAMKYSLFTK
jgi:hypothetical protein